MPGALFQVAVVQACGLHHGSRSGESEFGIKSILIISSFGFCTGRAPILCPGQGMVGSELAGVHSNFTVVSVWRLALACAVVISASL